jgi:DNA-binding transcriptional LysR family regulator
MVAILPADHVLAKTETIQVAQMVSDPFVMSKGGCEPPIRAIFERVGLTPRVAFEASDTGVVLAMVEEGLGVTIVPRFALSAASLHASILSLNPPVYRRLGLAVRPHASLSPAMKAFLHHIETC